MCGIAGFQFGKGFTPDSLYRSILLLGLAAGMDNRGGDSYGVAKVNKQGKIRVWKGIGHAVGNIDLPKAADTNQLILHTRKRTHGPINIENAHPLLQGHILGTHNGIVNNHDSLNEKYNRDFSLDSRHIFEHLRAGLDVGEIGVYGAISWIDLNNPNVVNLCRLSVSGDLEVYGIGKDKEHQKGVVYASTRAPIIAALQALREDYFPYESLETKRRYYIEDGRLMVDSSKEGRMPFDEHPFYQRKSYTGLGYRGTGDTWIAPKGLDMCKKCNKSYKKKRDFKPAHLCSSCWQNWLNLRFPGRDEEHQLGTDGSQPCSQCAQNTAFRLGGRPVCCACFNNLQGEKKSPVGERSPNLSLLKPGGSALDQYEKDETEEVEEALGLRKPTVVQPYLEEWDLCTWCAKEVQDNRKWDTSSFCAGCKAKWEAMLKDLRFMDSEERKLFAQVATCAYCRVVPIFGRLRSEAYTEDKKPKLFCKRCKPSKTGNCVECGKGDLVRTIYLPGEEDKGQLAVSLYPHCKDCAKKRSEKEKNGEGNDDKELAAAM